MNPYIQASLNPQLQLLGQQTGIQSAGEQAAATRSGAFGGSRQALQNALVQQGGDLAAQQAIGQGYNTAFNNAQQQMNAANAAALAGNQQALSGYGMGLQGANQAGNMALQGNQQALSGYGQAASQALQGLGMGLQGAGQAGSQAMQGYGMGLQGAGQAGQLGISGAQAGLAGIGAQQAGYGQAGQAGTNLANIGGQQLAAQQGIIGTQAQQGAAQQANAQQIINQGIQNYATAQQYPLMQLGTMSNMLRGLPMQAATTQQYQAAPSPLTQAVGLAGTTALLGSMKKGGLAKGIKGYLGGGIIDGTQADLEDMPTEALQKEMSVTQSPTIKNQIKQILQARAGSQYAGGGIIAFSDSTEANNQSVVKDDSKELYPGQLRDAAMYQGIGNFAKEVGSNIINPFNSLVNTGKSIVNWGQTDPRQQAKENYPDLYAAKQEANAAKNGMIQPVVSTPTTQSNNDWQGSANVASAPTAQTPPPPPAAKTAPGAITNVSPKPAVDPHVLATKASEEKTIKDGNDPNIPGYIKPLTQAEVDAQTEKNRQKLQQILGPDDSEAQLAKLDKRLERESKTFDKNEKLTFAGMFARMATTPGSFITAAMTGVQQGLPQLISNNEKRDQAINAVEDAKAAIAKAKRAEALGLYSESHKETMEAAKYMMDSNKIVVESQDKRYVADVGLEGHKVAAAATIEGHKISAGATKENTNYLAANRLQENADAVAEKARTSKPYVDAQKDVVTFKNNTSQFAKDKVAAAQKVIDDAENRIKINQARVEKVVNNLTPDRFKTDNTSSKVIKLD